jgi:hypothetical protein
LFFGKSTPVIRAIFYFLLLTIYFIKELALSLFKSGVFLIYDIQFAFAAHNLTIYTALFYGCPDLHTNIFCFLLLSFKFTTCI